MEVRNAKQMQQADRRAIQDLGVPSLTLMENAGSACARILLDALPALPRHRVLVLAGSGNNGGDGFVIARLLHEAGVPVTAALLAPEARISPDASANLALLRAAGGEIEVLPDPASWRAWHGLLPEQDVFVDAIFGTGFVPPVRSWHAEVIRDLNAAEGFVLSVDLPSGLSADSHRIVEPAVRADVTVALASLKICHVLAPACDLCGKVELAEIGIPAEAWEEEEGPELLLATAEWARAASLPLQRERGGHKGDYGRVLVVSGSAGKSGAAALVGLGALRAGAGLVTIATPRSVWPMVASVRMELMVEPVSETATGTIGLAALPRLRALLRDKDVLALGPGCSAEPETLEALRTLLHDADLPRVVDADGLLALGVPDPSAFFRTASHPLLLTPHPGEAGRLLGSTTAEVQEDRLASVRGAAARFGAVVALKGRNTLVAAPDGTTGVCTTGNPGMATAGTGDILTGMAAGLLGQGLHPWDALLLAVHLHGLAGDLAAGELGEVPMTATDLLDRVPAAFRTALPGDPLR